MCLLAVFFRVVEDCPLVVGGIREEVFDRGGDPPRLLEGSVRALAGTDPLAGGTWFGVNEHGLFVAVTNRRKSELPDKPRSRGVLARELLQCVRTEEAAEVAVRSLETNCYAGCNLVCANANQAIVVHGGDWLRIRPLPPGLHLLTNRDVNDASDSRLQRAAQYLGQQPCYAGENCVQAFRRLSVQREPEGLPICFCDGNRGTVSASIVALRPVRSQGTYLHAQGSPDRTPYADYSHLFQELDAGQPPAGAAPREYG
jgi:hypothetical protein